MAVADYPTVDPNDVNARQARPLGARLFSSPYEPGSRHQGGDSRPARSTQARSPSDTKIIVPGRHYASTGPRSRTPSSTATCATRPRACSRTRRTSASRCCPTSLSPSAPRLPGRSSGSVRRPRSTSSASRPASSSRPLELGPDHQRHPAVRPGHVGDDACRSRACTRRSATTVCGCRSTLVEGCQHAGRHRHRPPDTDADPRGRRDRREPDRRDDGDRRQRRALFTNITASPATASPRRPEPPRWPRTARTATPADRVGGGNRSRPRTRSTSSIVTFGEAGYDEDVGSRGAGVRAIMTQVIKTFRITPSRQKAPYIPLTW